MGTRLESYIVNFLNLLFQVIEGGGSTVSKEPLELTLPISGAPPTVAVTLTFHGHYNEPSVSLNCPLQEGSKVYDLTYDLSNVVEGWTVTEREQ